MWYNNNMADVTVVVQAIRNGGKMKKTAKKIALGVLVFVVAIIVGAGVISSMNNMALAQEQEVTRQQEQQEARDELQQLKGEVRVIQFLSAKSDFSAEELQEELDAQLRSSVERVEKSDNPYLQEVSIPIEETSVFGACDGVIEYIDYWISEVG